MFEHFNKPQELFQYQLGQALTMEDDSLQMLGELENAVRSPELKELFRHHADETRQQIENLHAVCTELGISVDEEPSPTTKGLAKEGTSLLHKSSEDLADTVAVAAALGTEHYEISVYEVLIAAAKGQDQHGVAELLSANCEQERHASEELTQKARELAHAG